MSDKRFVVTDIDFDSLDAIPSDGKSDPIVKEEIVRDDDILLFAPADMEKLGDGGGGGVGGAGGFEVVEKVGTASAACGADVASATFNIPFSDEQLNQLLGTNFSTAASASADVEAKAEIKTEAGFSHFVKYKVKDGKHTKVWQCGICSKEFGHQYILIRHLPTHTDERKFQCNICGKAFRQMSTLSQHRAIHSSERPYVCEICTKTFNRVSTLISHRKTHTGYKPHQCHLCNKAFHQKGNLRNHIFTHTNERPYKCDVCSKGFNQMSNLMCHKLKAHQRADKPRYTCQTCGKDFLKRVSLRNHEQYEHGDMSSIGNSNATARSRYMNGVLVDPINTAAMQHALATNQTPFALLRPLNSIPVLVRVLAAGDKQMLVPATAEDLKKHGQITITEKPQDSETTPTTTTTTTTATSATTTAVSKPPDSESSGSDGSTVQIKIPVVATVVQRCGKDGNMCMDVESPGPSSEGASNADGTPNAAGLPIRQETVTATVQNDVVTNDASMQFFDVAGNVMDLTAKSEREREFDGFDGSDVFDSGLRFDRDMIELDELNGSGINIYQGGIFEILDKPISDTVLDGGYDGNNLNMMEI